MTENVNTKPSERRKFFKQKARSLLYGDWLSHVLAFLIAGGVYYGTVQFGASVSILFAYLTGSAYMSQLWFALFLVFALLFVLPLIPGMLNFEMCAIERGKASISDLFYAYASIDELMRSYRIILYSFLNMVYFVPSIALKFFLDNIYQSGYFGVKISVGGMDAVLFALSVVYLVFTAFAFIMSVRGIMGIYVCLKRKWTSLSDCFFTARVCLRTHKKELAFLLLSFAPLCVLSLFTVGLLFVMYTIPYIMLTVTLYIKYLYDAEMCKQNAARTIYETENTEEPEESETDENDEINETSVMAENQSSQETEENKKIED